MSFEGNEISFIKHKILWEYVEKQYVWYPYSKPNCRKIISFKQTMASRAQMITLYLLPAS